MTAALPSGSQPSPIAHLCAVMEELIVVLQTEPELIRLRHAADHKELLIRKQRLLADYEQDMRALVMTPGVTHQLSPDMKAALKTLQTQLEVAVEKNERLLKAAMQATQHLVESVINAIRAETKQQQTYQNPMALLTGAVIAKQTHHPVALNRTI